MAPGTDEAEDKDLPCSGDSAAFLDWKSRPRIVMSPRSGTSLEKNVRMETEANDPPALSASVGGGSSSKRLFRPKRIQLPPSPPGTRKSRLDLLWESLGAEPGAVDRWASEWR